jgi:hypothetical protein
LGQTFPVTKGLAGRLNAAVRRRTIVNTGTTRHAKPLAASMITHKG